MADFPYSPNPASVGRFFSHVQSAGVPEKVTLKYLEKVGFKSKNDRYLLQILVVRRLMRKIGSLVLLGLVGVATGLVGQPSDEVILQDTTGSDGVRQVFAISKQSAEKQPAWSPEKDDPPLSISKALAIAKAAARKQRPKFDDFSLLWIQLWGMNCYPPVPNRWFWVVHLNPVIDGETLHSGNVVEVVLMDGTVVTPEKKPADRRFPRPAS
jgi:Family of unknown function (DUF5343)